MYGGGGVYEYWIGVMGIWIEFFKFYGFVGVCWIVWFGFIFGLILWFLVIVWVFGVYMSGGIG